MKQKEELNGDGPLGEYVFRKLTKSYMCDQQDFSCKYHYEAYVQDPSVQMINRYINKYSAYNSIPSDQDFLTYYFKANDVMKFSKVVRTYSFAN